MPKTMTASELSAKDPLFGFLKDHQTSTGEAFTHTSIGRPRGSYYITLDEYSTFLDIYHKTTFEDNIDVHLTEGIHDRTLTPFKIDIDFKYFAESPCRKYTDHDIDEICKLYVKGIEEWLEYPDDDERIFFILEKKHPTYDTTGKGVKKQNENGLFRIKDGVHIMAPSLVTVAHIQHTVRKDIIKQAGTIFDKYNFDNSYSDIFDASVIDRNNWQMYGSKKPGKEAYKVTRIIKVWQDKIEEVPLENYTTRQLVELLSVRNKDIESMVLGEKQGILWDATSEMELKKKRKTKGKATKSKHRTHSDEKTLKLIIEYIKCLSPDRAKSFTSWIEVGWCLYNLHNRDDVLLQEWIGFSKKSPDHTHEAEEVCNEEWSKMSGVGLGIASLKLWARQDNPTEYHKIVQKDYYSHIMNACKTKKGSAWDVAKVMEAMYADYYKCVSITNTTWYYYNTEHNRWIRDDKGINLKSKISTEVYNEFKKIVTDFQNKSDDAGDEYSEKAQKISGVMFKLKDTPFKSNLMHECSELFYDTDKTFLDKLDSNNNFLGCNNGVYDLNLQTFRKGRPEDYVSRTTKIDYIPYDPKSISINEINHMLKSMFIIKNVRDYVMKRCGSFLSGSTQDESFDIFSGGGGNGKSKFMELMENALGDYCCKLPITLLTGKRSSSNSATPDLARTKGVRLACLQEPDTNTKLNVGLMKELTGGDTIQARALYSEPFEFKPQFKLVLCCNDKPELPPHDEGTWRRVKNTEFITAYRPRPDEKSALQFAIDTSLSEKFEQWAEPFLSILIHYNTRYQEEKLEQPDEILEYTDEYRATGNQFRDFINERTEDSANSRKIIGISEMYKIYKEWHKDNHSGEFKKKKELQMFLDEKFGANWISGNSTKEKGYKGFKIIYPATQQNQANEQYSFVSDDELDT